ncbi:MAG: Gfo/Idh/MocA family oxidoreductase [Alphaproteobacteria bacterium]|nr:Gfo/Idh/MocA family oxidoreductase [Alphaproteobacteria bacterium]
MSNSASVGVLGTGYWGKNLLRNLDALGALSAFSDTDTGALEMHAGTYPDARAYTSAQELLADRSLTAVAISTPAATHGDLVEAALTAGKDVFVEKPLCLDLDQAHRLDELAQSGGRVLMIGHLLLYHPAFIAVQESVARGDIGRLRYIYSNRASLGKIRREENALWSFAPHDISMMLALTGRLPERVVCNGEAWLSPNVADMSLSHFDFGEHLQGHIFVSWMHPFKDHRLVVVGEDGMIVFNDTLAGDQKVLRYPHRLAWDGVLPMLEKAEAVPVPYRADEPLAEEMRHFLDCCETRARPRTDATEAIGVLSVLDMCQRAMTSGTPLERAAE